MSSTAFMPIMQNYGYCSRNSLHQRDVLTQEPTTESVRTEHAEEFSSGTKYR